jgi:hypothetical protein
MVRLHQSSRACTRTRAVPLPSMPRRSAASRTDRSGAHGYAGRDR